MKNTNEYVYRMSWTTERTKKSINIRFKPATVTSYELWIWLRLCGVRYRTKNESFNHKHVEDRAKKKERKTKSDQSDLSLNELMVNGLKDSNVPIWPKWKFPKFSFSFVKLNHFSFNVNHTFSPFSSLENKRSKKKRCQRNSSLDKLPGALLIIIIVCSRNII